MPSNSTLQQRIVRCLPEDWEEFKEACRIRGMKPATMLRRLIHLRTAASVSIDLENHAFDVEPEQWNKFAMIVGITNRSEALRLMMRSFSRGRYDDYVR